jgi:hypothetical protein
VCVVVVSLGAIAGAMFAFGTAFSAAPEEIFLLCGSVCMWVCGWIGLVVGVFGLLGLVGAWFWQWKACA